MTSNLKTKSAAAATSLRSAADARVKDAEKAGKVIPMLGLPQDAVSTEVMNFWFQNQSNIDNVEARIGKKSQTLRSRMVDWYPIVYARISEAGWVEPPFPGRQAVLVALDTLDKNNGLPEWDGGPNHLAQGEWDQMSDSQTLRFTGQGGGLALLFIFSK